MIAIAVAVKGNDANVSVITVGIASNDAGDVGRFYAGNGGGSFHLASDTVRFVSIPIYYEPTIANETIWIVASISSEIMSIAYAAGGSDKTIAFTGAILSDVQGTGQGVTTATTRNYSIYAVQAA